ncbi:hypothetical protein [Corynebacterium frankenforstense]
MTSHLRPSVALGAVTASLTAALVGPATAVAAAAEVETSPVQLLAADGSGHFPVLGLTIGACILVVGLACVAAFVYIKHRELKAAEKAAAEGRYAGYQDGYQPGYEGGNRAEGTDYWNETDNAAGYTPGAEGTEGESSRVLPRGPETTQFKGYTEE